MKTEILTMLKHADGYLSGQALCEQLNVSRTAVWKVIKQLQEEGYGIEAVRNRGYRLREVADVITKAELESRLTSLWAGRHLEYYDEVDSTNTKARQLADAGAVHGTLVVADHQTAGKGRRGRSWVSTPGDGIWMSILLRPDLLPCCASMLTLAAALAVADGIEKETGCKTMIKWPNDIVADGRKICGILTEMSSELDMIHYVVTGIGINVNTPVFLHELADKATSLYLLTGEQKSRSGIIAAIMEAFEYYYGIFLQDGNLSRLKEVYESKMAGRGSEQCIQAAHGDYIGILTGIDDEGRLLVQMKDGSERKVTSGEVSIRGVYGYI